MMYKLSRGFTLVLFFDSINRQRIFPEKMKSVILIVVISSFFCVNVYCTEFPFGPSKGGSFGGKCNGIAGPFCVVVTYIYPWNTTECPNSVVENTVNKTKLNRYEEGVSGCMNILKDIKGPVGAKMKIAEQSKNGGGLLKVLMNGANTENLCNSTSYKTFLDKFHIKVYDDECNFKKANSCLKPALNLNKVIHEYIQTITYGNFHFDMSYEVNGQCILGYHIGLNIKCESDCKRPKS